MPLDEPRSAGELQPSPTPQDSEIRLEDMLERLRWVKERRDSAADARTRAYYESVLASLHGQTAQAQAATFDLATAFLPRDAPGSALDTPRPNYTSFSEADRALAELDTGSAAFSAPQTMRVGEKSQARLRISPVASETELERGLRAVAPPNAPVEASPSVPIHQVMVAKLDTTAGLGVRLLSGESERVLGSESIEEWVWEIEARQAGSETLHLELFAVFEIQGSQRKVLLRTWEAKIPVNVAPFQVVAARWFGKHFQWFFAVIVVPLVGLLWRRWRRKTTPAAVDGTPTEPEVPQ
ncbi:MAG: hypothetical protein K8I65_00135 [Thermoanaerobaculia bacterium]|nr:hypothetical protein [Thermoanaerobaculia bacterium]